LEITKFQPLQLLVGLYLLFAKNGMFDRVKIEKPIFNMDMVKDVLKFGVPTAIGNSFWNFAKAQSLICRFIHLLIICSYCLAS